MLKKLLTFKYGWAILVLLLVAVNYISSLLHFRLDLTGEKRYTISEPTTRLIEELPDRVDITVFLDGDMPAGFKKLAGSTNDMLSSFKSIAPNLINFHFERPGQGMDDTTRAYLYDSLRRMGINPTNVKAQTKEGESSEETLVYPGAIIKYLDRTVGVDFLQGQSSLDGINSLNNAEALLEYKLANAIHKVTQDSLPVVGYLSGNGEPVDYRVYDLIENTLRPNYGFSIIPIDSVRFIPQYFSTVLIVKPIQRFSEQQKLKIDQYIVNGGKVIWMLDNLYASLDSLQRSQGEFIAFDLGLNLEDQLFRYGARINQDLVQSLESDKIPSVVGNMGDKPQIEILAWPYFPLLSNSNNHPVAKNLDYVIAEFPHSIDTIKTPGIKKTVLLHTAAESRTLQTPAKVEWSSIRTEEDLRSFNKGKVPVAMLLEGKFQSLYSSRIAKATADSMANIYKQPFKPVADAENKMIVIADGDLALNQVSRTDGPLAMGMNSYTRQQFANREFLLNSIEYMVDNSGILETRSKDYTLRLINKTSIEEDKSFWQLINIILPLLCIIAGVAVYQIVRRKAYTKAAS
jgi:gliding-associated putative ABC transporter substrate-binding component GldG